MRRPGALLTALVLVPLGACAQIADVDRGDGGGPGAGHDSAALARGDQTVRVIAVGDIACRPGLEPTRRTCRQAATARLARGMDPDRVVALGDLQYERGRLRAFRRSYDRSWGRLKPITLPVPGNHEYKTGGAAGYDAYFDRNAPEWYAWEAGSWRIYNLDTNCGEANCAAELEWLAGDLEANPRDCSMIAMHHPRFSSGEHGPSPAMKKFWKVAYAHRVDLAVAGHDHDYERFARMNPSGELRPHRGIQSFVSGTGGRSLYSREHNPPGSRYFNGRRFGVLLLTLRDGEWSWKHRTIDGVVRDSGSRSCV